MTTRGLRRIVLPQITYVSIMILVISIFRKKCFWNRSKFLKNSRFFCLQLIVSLLILMMIKCIKTIVYTVHATVIIIAFILNILKIYPLSCREPPPHLTLTPTPTSHPLSLPQWGVERVGLLGFGWLSVSLTLCVASVFAPGSLFYLASPYPPAGNTSAVSNTSHELRQLGDTYTGAPLPPPGFNASLLYSDDSPTTVVSLILESQQSLLLNMTENAGILANVSESQEMPSLEGVTGAVVSSYCSVTLLLVGIIISRFGELDTLNNLGRAHVPFLQISYYFRIILVSVSYSCLTLALPIREVYCVR